MTEFERAMNDYEEHFGACYPCAIGFGYPCKTEDENIALIRKCIAENKPYDFEPDYKPGLIY